jgi:hypothetical protein
MTDITTSTTPAGTERRADPRLWAGIGFVAVFLIGLIISSALTTGRWPMPGASADAVLAFFLANPQAIAVTAFTQVLAAIPLAVFSSGLSRTFGGMPAPQLTVAGALAAGTLLVSGALSGALTNPAVAGQPALAAVLAYLTFLVGGPVHVVALALLLGTTAVAGRLSGRLPGWLTTFGFVVAALGVLSSVNLLMPAPPPLAVAVFIPAGRFLGFAFIVAAVFALRRNRAAAG